MANQPYRPEVLAQVLAEAIAEMDRTDEQWMVDVSAECGSDGDVRVSGSEIALRFPINSYFEDWIRNAACVKQVQAWNA